MSARENRGSFVIAAEQAGGTVAAALRALAGGAEGLSWRAAKELCLAGRVAVDGHPAIDPAARVEEGQKLTIGEHAAEQEHRLLVYVDPAVAVVDKPPGVLTTPVERTDRGTLLHLAAVEVRRHDARKATKGSPSLRAVQRLDRDTSGLLVFARTVPAERNLQLQLKNRTVWRRYLALVQGHAIAGTHSTHLMADRGDGLRGSWERLRREPGERPPASARLAVTHVTVERQFRDATLVSCRLETGRQHQIRIHLSEAGTPLLGEPIYVRGSWLRGAKERARRPMLHAVELGFVHPSTRKELRFTAEPPPDFARLLSTLERAEPA